MKHGTKSNRHPRGNLIIVAGILVAGALLTAWLVSLPVLGPVPASAAAITQAQVRSTGAIEVGTVTGEYGGQVDLDWVAAGVYSDTLTAPTRQSPSALPAIDLGVIDLVLQLTQTGSAVSGYVVLDRTLVFTQEHTVGTTPVGPYVQGTFDGTNLSLRSERVSLQVAEQAVMREFALTGTSGGDQATKVSGEYRETIWGFAPQPLTVVGSFELERVVFELVVPNTPEPPPTPQHSLSLPLVLGK